MLLLAKQLSEKNKQELVIIDEVKTPGNSIVTLPHYTNNLSLDVGTGLTRDEIFDNVKVKAYNLTLTPEQATTVKKRVGRLVTGAHAAVPLLCRGNDCPFKKTCITGDAWIMYGYDKYKQLKDVQVGDAIYAFADNGHLYPDIVTAKTDLGLKEVYTITTLLGKTLTLTKDHPVWTEFNGYMTFRSIQTGLSVGSSVFIVDNSEDPLPMFGDFVEDSIESITEAGVQTVYDLTIKEHETFIANSIAVHNCPYFEIGQHPLNDDCLVEAQLIEVWTHRYVEEFNIDLNSLTEVHLMSRLVEISIYELRMTKYLSLNDQSLMMDFVASVDPAGNVISNKGVSVAFEVKERLERQKMKILESLNGTREKKVKIMLQAKQGVEDSSMSALKAKVELLASQLSIRTVK